MRRTGALCLVLMLLGIAPADAQEEYPVDIPDLDRKPFSVGGFLELRPVFFRLDPDAALYHLRFPSEPPRPATTRQFNSQVQLDVGYRRGMVAVETLTVFDANHDTQGWAVGAAGYEAYVSLKPTPSLLDIGKKTLKWGKGYVWNPAAFLDRPKNPDDPALALEGFVAISADFIRSFDGPLRTLSLSPALVPVFDGVNESFGASGHLNPAGRLYLLLYDTDLDFMLLAAGSRAGRIGMDLSRNLASNLEIHGEVAWIRDAAVQILQAEGGTVQRRLDAASLVVGLRYLAVTNTTFIVDVYHNGIGYTKAEMEAFFDFVRRASDVAAVGDDQLLQQALRAGQGGYTRTAPMRNYVYGRVSQPDAIDVLYLNVGLTAVVNLDDRSFSLMPELSYKASENLELRSQVGLLVGGPDTEFGEKQANLRLELRARYYF